MSYVSSKFAVRGIAKTAALEFSAFGIRVNSVHPGAVDTPMIAPSGTDEPAADARNIRKGLPLQRISDPLEIARTRPPPDSHVQPTLSILQNAA